MMMKKLNYLTSQIRGLTIVGMVSLILFLTVLVLSNQSSHRDSIDTLQFQQDSLNSLILKNDSLNSISIKAYAKVMDIQKNIIATQSTKILQKSVKTITVHSVTDSTKFLKLELTELNNRYDSLASVCSMDKLNIIIESELFADIREHVQKYDSLKHSCDCTINDLFREISRMQLKEINSNN